MTFSPSKAGFATLMLGGLGIAYPFVVHATLGRVPAGAIVLLAVALVAARIAMLRGQAAARALLPPLVAVAVATGGLGLIDPAIATKAYPVMMSLGFAAAFGLSLLRPPSLVEIFASLAEPHPSPAARAYMRRVSAVWLGFLVINAALSLSTALWADTWVWALYNGLISYVLMGILFAGEWLVRRRVRAAAETPE
jgi:uncharacterized membrane protein